MVRPGHFSTSHGHIPILCGSLSSVILLGQITIFNLERPAHPLLLHFQPLSSVNYRQGDLRFHFSKMMHFFVCTYL